MKKIIVFVVMEGEKHEGGTVVGVFRNLQDAKKCALEQKYYGEPWYEILGSLPRWESGCDRVEIETWEIK